MLGFVGNISIEHDDVEIVAANDPFIDPEYAVSIMSDSIYCCELWTVFLDENIGG